MPNFQTAATRDNPDTTVVYSPTGNPIVLDLRDTRQTPMTAMARSLVWGSVGTLVGLILHWTLVAVMAGLVAPYWILVVLGVFTTFGTVSYQVSPGHNARWVNVLLLLLFLCLTIAFVAPLPL